MLTGVFFLSEGFSNWKKAIETFRDHQESRCHQAATESMIELPKKCRGVAEIHSDKLTEQKQLKRRIFVKVLQNTQFLARQGLALQGNDDKESNFLQLMKLRGKDDSNIELWIQKKTDKYTSHDIQNEILDVMAKSVLREIVDQIKQAGFYSLLADECTDIANKEQLTICLRWIDDKLQPNEEFVGFYEIPYTNAETIATVIKDVLFRIGLPLRSCRGQCYDGAGPMTGIKNGLGVIIQREVPTAHLTHCHGHALSLAVHDTTKGSKILSDAMDTSREVCKLIKFSPKRQAFLERIKDDMKIDAPGIKVLCPNRWKVRAESFNRIIENYDALVKLWNECLDTKLDTEMRARIIGVRAQMLDFNYVFGVNLGAIYHEHSNKRECLPFKVNDWRN